MRGSAALTLPAREGIEQVRMAPGHPQSCPGDRTTCSMVGPPKAAETPSPKSLAALACPPTPPFQGGEE
jgi:hypothetical protein